MPELFWWLLWGGLAVGALMVYAIILARLARSAKKLAKPVEALTEATNKLASSAAERPEAIHPESNIDDDLDVLVAKRQNLLAERRKRKQAAKRRLVARVRSKKLEGRFKDVR